jgi:hypothetical protein
MHKFLLPLCIALTFAAAATAQPAATAPVKYEKAADIPVDVFFRRAQYSSIQLSPDGERLAAIVPLNGRGNLVTIELKTQKRTLITGFKDSDVAGFRWINSRRLYLTSADLADATGSIFQRGAFAVDADGGNLRDMSWPLDSAVERRMRRESISLDTRA